MSHDHQAPQRDHKAFEALVTRAKTWCGQRTVAVFSTFPGETEQTGTGVLLRIGDCHFLLTAAHVADDAHAREGELCIADGAAGAPAIRVEGTQLTSSSVPKSQGRAADRIDVALLLLADHVVEQLRERKKFVELSEIDTPDQGWSEARVGVFGFPHAFSKREPDGSLHYGEMFLMTQPVRTPRFKREEVITAVMLQYPRQGIVHCEAGSPCTLKANAPVLHGVSGSGVWRVDQRERSETPWSEGEIRLIAVLRDWRRKHGALVGTKLEGPLVMAYRWHPKTRSAIRAAFPGVADSVEMLIPRSAES